MKITVFSADPGNHKFIEPIMQKLGVEWRIQNSFTPDDADVYWFDFCDNNLIVASTEFKEDLQKRQVIARLHAVEYYLGFYKSIDWSAVNHLIFVSEHLRDKVGPLPVATHVIHNGIDLAKLSYRPRARGFNLAYAGNIVPNKGILLMFHYFKNLLNKDDRYRLHLVGLNRFHGRDGEYYQHYLDAAGLRPYVNEGGEVNNINDWLEDKDFLWQPSLCESFSLIVGEAMAKGIKPIINDFSGSKSLWPNECIYQDFDEFMEILCGEYESPRYMDFVKRYDINKAIATIWPLLGTAT